MHPAFCRVAFRVAARTSFFSLFSPGAPLIGRCIRQRAGQTGKEYEEVKAIFKKPGKEPEIIEVENTQEALEDKVGGSVKSHDFAVDARVLYDEEWQFKYYGSQVICGMLFGGPILIVGVDGEEFCDLPQPEVVKELIWPTREDARYKK